jgi:hypothetical protein
VEEKLMTEIKGVAHFSIPVSDVGCQQALRDRIFAATHRLADLEAFELRMVEVERLVLASVPMGKTECFRLGPGFERHLALPYRV